MLIFTLLLSNFNNDHQFTHWTYWTIDIELNNTPSLGEIKDLGDLMTEYNCDIIFLSMRIGIGSGKNTI